MTDTTLLPCPFCGSPNVKPCYVRRGRQVHCVACDAFGPPARHHAGKPSRDTDDRAIAAWNRRAVRMITTSGNFTKPADTKSALVEVTGAGGEAP